MGYRCSISSHQLNKPQKCSHNCLNKVRRHSDVRHPTGSVSEAPGVGRAGQGSDPAPGLVNPSGSVMDRIRRPSWDKHGTGSGRGLQRCLCLCLGHRHRLGHGGVILFLGHLKELMSGCLTFSHLRDRMSRLWAGLSFLSLLRNRLGIKTQSECCIFYGASRSVTGFWVFRNKYSLRY